MSAGARPGTPPGRVASDWRDTEMKNEQRVVERGDDPPGLEFADCMSVPNIDAEPCGIDPLGREVADWKPDPETTFDTSGVEHAERLKGTVTRSYPLRGRREEDSEDYAEALVVVADAVHPQPSPLADLASSDQPSDVLCDDDVDPTHLHCEGRSDQTRSGQCEGSPSPSSSPMKKVSRAGFKCKYCRKTCISKFELEKHLRVHTGKRPFKCETCEQTFTRKENLAVHIRTHTGEKPYVCDFCKQRFSLKHHLVTHTRKHTGEKPYQCDFCKQRFSQKSNLVKHIRTHTGEKPHRCDFCKHRFADRSTLVQHFRTHTGEKPYKCDQCEKCFAQTSHRTKHVRNHHT
ncbi:zinc finger protein 3-like [Frankliniella occidentalis]|uniref:Zinc finger protein 3-like n=1 Tax=Frankliniella occidentalis TaxID=133901 RepID=A0A6J1SYH3_FRAOC|nr:zinc finger protein 3-like [Frankliniella occidentalis]